MRKIYIIFLLAIHFFSFSSNLYFKNCSEAKEKGYSNIKKGESGYRPELDRDNDGIACETK